MSDTKSEPTTGDEAPKPPETPEKEASAGPQGASVGRLFKNATTYAVGQAIVSVLSFVTDPILSYLLTLADFGLLGLTRTLTNFQQNFYRLGLDGAANRIYYDVENDRAAQRRALGTINTFLLAWTLFLTVIQEVAGPGLYRRLFDDIEYSPYGRFVAYALFCNTLIVVAQSVWGAQERAKLVAGTRLVTALLGVVITFGLLFATKLGVLAVFVSQVASATIMLWVHLRFAYRSFGFAWDKVVLRRALAFGLPMVVHLTSHWALELADRIILEKLMDRDAVGLYSVAYGILSTLMMINGSVNAAYVPQFTRMRDKPEGDAFVSRAITYVLLVVLGASLGFILLAPTVIRLLYSEKFAPAAALTPVLALAAPLQAVYLVFVNGLFRESRTGRIPFLTLLAGLLNVGLNLLWIPKYGVMGAALATVAGYGGLAMFFWLGTRNVVKLPFEGKRIARVVLTFVVIMATSMALDARLPIAAELAAKLVLLVAAPLLLSVSGFLEPHEREWANEKLRGTWARLRGRPE